ncbi:MAG: hypothetical protein Q9184_001982 [Pyrenodesmia sp. 2 TL-2023]
MDHWQTDIITTNTKSFVAEGNKHNPSSTIPNPRVRQAINPLPVPTSLVASGPTEALTVINFFNGVQPLSITTTLPLTMIAPTTITTSGLTKTISGTIAVAPDDGSHIYPHDGCWNDPNCWWSHTHSLAMPTATSRASIEGYGIENQPSSKRFFKDAAPYVGLGIGISCLIVLCFWLAMRYRAQKQMKRKQDAKERQTKRMGEGEGGEEVTAEGGSSDGERIELEMMRGDRREPGQEGGFRESRSDTWATHATAASSDTWFVMRRSTTDDFV